MEIQSQDSLSQTPPTASPKPPLPKAAVVAACVVLLVAGAAVGYWLKRLPQVPQQASEKVPPQAAAQAEVEVLPTSTPDSPLNSSGDAACGSYTAATRQLSGEILWEKASQIEPLDIFSPDASASVRENSKFYRVGAAAAGSYKGAEVILADIAVEGPAFYPLYYRFVRQGGKLVLLGKYSPELTEWDGLDHSKLTVDNGYYVSDLDYPAAFQGGTNRENFMRDDYATFRFCSDGLVKTFYHAVLGDVYSTPVKDRQAESGLAKNYNSYGFYLASPDGTAKVYKLDVDFVGEDNVPAVTWADGSKNTQEYTYTDIGGCGSTNYLAVVAPTTVNPGPDLMEAGTNSFGDNVFALKDPNHPLLKDIFDNQYYVYQGEKVSYDVFVKSRPAFFWYDPFGRLIKFQNNKFVPLAECAKPVIYLYPESRQNVSVRLAPAGGFLVSEPSYDRGWNVLADPSGLLTNRADGKTYPYLFWEGRGGLYPESTDKGFVVAQDDVHNFLVEKLAKLGLNIKESADFMEFWEPKMRAAPYFFITFYGAALMDMLAPLNITPAPDTVIRVLMDYRALEAPIAVESYNIQTPIRRGFTVVEWGGVLRSR